MRKETAKDRGIQEPGEQPPPDRMHTVLVVDDEDPVRESLELLLEDRYFVITAASGEEALETLGREAVDLVVLDVTMPRMGGEEALRRIRALPSPPDVVMLSATDSARLGARAIKEGAYDYLTKPFDNEDLLDTLSRVIEKRRLASEVVFLRSEVEKMRGFGDLVGNTPCMRAIFEMVAKVSLTDSSVLITGESGTGKELVARAIHSRGLRAQGPFIPVNCAAIPQELLESEFFGHERGSFTGAFRQKIGKVELAHKGILFLDEVSSLKPELQAKLLRVLQDRQFARVGGCRSLRADVQFIAATNRDLKEMTSEGGFRQDLYYRLNVVPIHTPPLREHREDIPLLVEHFIRRLGERLGKRVPGITREALDLLVAYHWPGNVRELENMLERMVVLAPGEAPITAQEVPMEITIPDCSSGLADADSAGEGLLGARGRFERAYILSTLKKTGGNQSEASRLLGIHRNTLIKKMAAMGIKPLE